MLLVLFHIGKERYAVDSGEVIEIVPLVQFRPIPRTPEYVAGLFLYRGQIVPVIDLCALAGHGPAKKLLSTRILLVRYPGPDGQQHVLGLVAEQVTDTTRVDEKQLKSSGVTARDAPYLGEILPDSEGMVQKIRIADLIPAEAQKLLFQGTQMQA